MPFTMYISSCKILVMVHDLYLGYAPGPGNSKYQRHAPVLSLPKLMSLIFPHITAPQIMVMIPHWTITGKAMQFICICPLVSLCHKPSLYPAIPPPNHFSCHLTCHICMNIWLRTCPITSPAHIHIFIQGNVPALDYATVAGYTHPPFLLAILLPYLMILPVAIPLSFIPSYASAQSHTPTIIHILTMGNVLATSHALVTGHAYAQSYFSGSCPHTGLGTWFRCPYRQYLYLGSCLYPVLSLITVEL